MSTTTLPKSNRFLNFVGAELQIAVPDTGTPGAEVILTRPDGERVRLDPELEQCAPVPAAGDRPAIVGRLHIRTRRPFRTPGVYRLDIDQDGTLTTYEVTVIWPARPEDRDDAERVAAEIRAWRRSLVEVPEVNELTPAFHPATK